MRQQIEISPLSPFRDWVDYRDGFGDYKQWNDEFWLGNEHIYSLLSEGWTYLPHIAYFTPMKYCICSYMMVSNLI